jgi:hypothetical protein
MMICN